MRVNGLKPAPVNLKGKATPMMININAHRADFERAWARAEKMKAQAELLVSDGQLFKVPSVREKGQWHLVEIFQNAEGEIVAACDCLAGQSGRICYHIAAAAQTFVKATEEQQLFDAADFGAVM
jgi:hypothetical protein